MRTPLTSAILVAVPVLFLCTQLMQAQDSPSCIGGGLFAPIMMGFGPKGPPFSAVVKSTLDEKLADGNTIHGVARYHVARNASGETLTEMPGSCFTGEDGQRHQSYQVSVYDPSSRTVMHWQVDGTNHTATITHMPAPVMPSAAEIAARRSNAAARAKQAPAISERQTEKLGTQSLQGVLAEGTRTTETIPVGEQGNALPLVIVNEQWYARELGITMMMISEDPRRGRTVVEVEELNQGDPPPSMFAPPEGYQVKEVKEQITTVTTTESAPPAP
jgi:hypothetical protein